MKLKPFLFGILLLLFSIPLVLFISLTYFNCGFVNERLCCSFDYNLCCMSSEYTGCINTYNSDLENKCRNDCFEMRQIFLAGFNINYLITLDYCKNNCSAYFPCEVMLVNGTEIEQIC